MGVVAHLSLSGSGREVGWRLFEARRLLTFSAFRMGAYSRLGAYSNNTVCRSGFKPCQREGYFIRRETFLHRSSLY